MTDAVGDNGKMFLTVLFQLTSVLDLSVKHIRPSVIEPLYGVMWAGLWAAAL